METIVKNVGFKAVKFEADGHPDTWNVYTGHNDEKVIAAINKTDAEETKEDKSIKAGYQFTFIDQTKFYRISTIRHMRNLCYKISKLNTL